MSNRPCAGLQSRPLPLLETIPSDRVEEFRAFGCLSYDDCLEHAAIANWPSFSCAGCPRGGLPTATLDRRVGAGDGSATNSLTNRLRALLTGEAREWTLEELATQTGTTVAGANHALRSLLREGAVQRVGPRRFASQPASGSTP